ncbi:MAG: DUF45 domain-containing protein [Thomasclavelia sp.]|nr:DUF45 domain-containing protein [Thomasclavelia sp.]
MEEKRILLDNKEIVYYINYKDIKSLRMYFKEGKFIINSSKRYSNNDIEKFMLKNKKFIFKHLNSYVPKAKYQDNGYIYIFGKVYNIVVNDQKSKMVKVFGNDIFVFNKQVEKTLDKYLKKELYNYAYERIVSYVNDYFECNIPSLEIKNYKSRWGTYYKEEHKISLNKALIHFKPEIIDSVIMHELVHTLHMNHSKEFYDDLLARMPDYKKRDKVLKEKGI